MQQRTPEWFAIRCGKFTGSRCIDIMSVRKDGKASEMRENYLSEIVLERISGVCQENDYMSAAMQAGLDREAKARAVYGFIRGIKVEEVGFIEHPVITLAGCSPDGLVGVHGAIEIKCPQAKAYLRALRGDPPDRKYLLQCQWLLACSRRKWCDLIFDRSEHGLCQVSYRITRDERAIHEIETEVIKFLAEVEATLSAVPGRKAA